MLPCQRRNQIILTSISVVLQVNGLIKVSTTLTWVIWIPPKGTLNLNGTKSPTALHKECMSFKKRLKKWNVNNNVKYNFARIPFEIMVGKADGFMKSNGVS